MNEYLISVIIPVYNADKDIFRCIESIKKQTYDNFECILINDGSLDESESVIKNCIKNDNRFKYIYQSNKGPSVARNKGIELSKGKYLVFVDSDDYVEEVYLEKLLNKIEEGNDLVCCGYNDISIYGNVKVNEFLSNEFTKKDLVSSVLKGTGGVLWNKIYKKEFLNKYNIRFDDSLFMSEDLIFNLEYIYFVKRWNVLTDSLYNYMRLNSNSISKNIDISYLDNFEKLIDRQKKCLNKLDINENQIEKDISKKITQIIESIVMNSKNRKKTISTIKSNKLFNYYFKKYYSNNAILKLAYNERIYILNLYIISINITKKFIRLIRKLVKI